MIKNVTLCFTTCACHTRSRTTIQSSLSDSAEQSCPALCLLIGTQAVCKVDWSTPAMLQNEKLVIDEFLEKVAAASRKVSLCF